MSSGAEEEEEEAEKGRADACLFPVPRLFVSLYYNSILQNCWRRIHFSFFLVRLSLSPLHAKQSTRNLNENLTRKEQSFFFLSRFLLFFSLCEKTNQLLKTIDRLSSFFPLSRLSPLSLFLYPRSEAAL